MPSAKESVTFGSPQGGLSIIRLPPCLRWACALVALLAAGLAAAPAALADTTIGQANTPTLDVWFGGQEMVNSNAVVPAGGGTITSFQTQSSDSCTEIDSFYQGSYDFQALRPLGAGRYLVVGETGNQADPCDGDSHSYPVNIPVQAGDVLGVYVVHSWAGVIFSTITEVWGFQPEPHVGDQVTLANSMTTFSGIDESATVVRDSDLRLTDMPSDMTVDAVGPAGTTVNYTMPSPADEDLSTAGVNCSPSRGTTFAIGTTKVTCTVTDTDGDANSPVSQSFDVTVRGAPEQLAALCAASDGVGPGKSLATKCGAAQEALSAGQDSEALSFLAAYVSEVNAQTGKKLSPGSASNLAAAAQQIAAVIGP